MYAQKNSFPLYLIQYKTALIEVGNDINNNNSTAVILLSICDWNETIKEHSFIIILYF